MKTRTVAVLTLCAVLTTCTPMTAAAELEGDEAKCREMVMGLG